LYCIKENTPPKTPIIPKITPKKLPRTITPTDEIKARIPPVLNFSASINTNAIHRRMLKIENIGKPSPTDKNILEIKITNRILPNAEVNTKNAAANFHTEIFGDGGTGRDSKFMSFGNLKSILSLSGRVFKKLPIARILSSSRKEDAKIIPVIAKVDIAANMHVLSKGNRP